MRINGEVTLLLIGNLLQRRVARRIENMKQLYVTYLLFCWIDISCTDVVHKGLKSFWR